MAGLSTGVGGGTAGGGAEMVALPAGPVPPAAMPTPTSDSPTMVSVGPEIVNVTTVPSGAGCPVPSVTVAVTVWTSPGARKATGWLKVTFGVPAEEAPVSTEPSVAA